MKITTDFLSVQDQIRYTDFIDSLKVVRKGLPYLIVVGADTHTLQNAILSDIDVQLIDYQIKKNPLNDDAFRQIFQKETDKPFVIYFDINDTTQLEKAARLLLFYRDEVVHKNRQVIVVVNEALFNTISEKTFDVIAAAGYAECFNDLQAQMNADFAPSTEKSWNEKKYERLLKEWNELQETPDENLRVQLNVGFNLGMITYELSRLDDALGYYEKALELSEKLENITT